MHREGYSTWSVCVYVCVCVSVTMFLLPRAIGCPTSGFSAIWVKNGVFIAKLWPTAASPPPLPRFSDDRGFKDVEKAI